MSSPRGLVIQELERAARTEGDAEFDAALDHLLEQARSAADPGAGVPTLISERLERELGATESSGAGASELAALAGARGSGVRTLVSRAPRWVAYGRGVGLLAAGVAIGFIWGRSPSWLAAERLSSLDAAVEAPSQGSIGTGPSAAGVQADGTSTGAVTPLDANAVEPRSPAATDASSAGSSTIKGRRETTLGSTTETKHLPRPTESSDSLGFALAQLRKAQLFLQASEPARALDALNELDARTPLSILREEREVTRALALCDAGEVNKASELAAGVLERNPDSAYVLSLRESCAQLPESVDTAPGSTSNQER